MSVNAVAVVNRSAVPDARVALVVEAYRDEVIPVAEGWLVDPWGIAFYSSDHYQNVQEEAAIFVVDTASEPDALGYHTALGKSVWGYVDLNMCRAFGEPWDRVFGHELFELGVDPYVNRWAGPYPDGSHVAIEVCDPVQRDSWTKGVHDRLLGSAAVEIADWVYPSWFDVDAGPGPRSYLKAPIAPLEDAPGGYHVTELNGVVLPSLPARVKNFGRTFRRQAKGRGRR